MADAGAIALGGAELAMTTDSYVVKPLRFPGGSIGELAVNGTVNDLAVSGSRPVALSLSLILEEGLPADELRAEVEAIAAAARAASVEIVTGDTKVVERGHADGMYICTTGVGRRDPRATLSPANLRPGDRILLSGPRRRARHRDHARAGRVRARRLDRVRHAARCGRRSMRCSTPPGRRLRCMRDATRGGVASVLNELARASSVAMIVREGDVPVDPAVAGAAEILGIDPMYVANEGKMVVFVAAEAADEALAALRGVPRLRAGGRDRRGPDRAAGDGAGTDEFWRPAGDGPTGRGPLTADLLKREETAMATMASPYAKQKETEAVTAHVLWMTTGLSCEGDSVAMTSATNPSLEDIILQAIPGMPKVVVHNQVVAYAVGQEYAQAWFDAEEGKLDPFVLVIEGSLGNEEINGDGYWTAFAVNPSTGQPITMNEWLDRLAPKAAAVVAVGTCATYGGIPAMKNNPTGAMGVPDYLGWGWKSKAGLPIVCIPGCPAQPDNMTETLLYLALHLAGLAPAPELDEALRPKWLFGRTVREGCNRAGFAEQGDFATEYGSDHRCLVKLGCKGPVVKCNVPVRGWVNGVGGCPNVGGICMACTMPGFPDKYMPFMDEDKWGAAAHGSSSSPTDRSCATCASGISRTSTTRNRSGGGQGKHADRPATPSGGDGARLAGRTFNRFHAQAQIEETSRWRLRHPRSRRSWSRRCRGIRSHGSSAASASTPRSTSPTSRCSSATARR